MVFWSFSPSVSEPIRSNPQNLFQYSHFKVFVTLTPRSVKIKEHFCCCRKKLKELTFGVNPFFEGSCHSNWNDWPLMRKFSDKKLFYLAGEGHPWTTWADFDHPLPPFYWINLCCKIVIRLSPTPSTVLCGLWMPSFRRPIFEWMNRIFCTYCLIIALPRKNIMKNSFINIFWIELYNIVCSACGCFNGTKAVINGTLNPCKDVFKWFFRNVGLWFDFWLWCYKNA